uniref:Uncharacterized protein n=1 Tax=Paramoeba aestuarina TaxID=180227 RepID=A0A7S4L301_9EUKA
MSQPFSTPKKKKKSKEEGGEGEGKREERKGPFLKLSTKNHKGGLLSPKPSKKKSSSSSPSSSSSSDHNTLPAPFNQLAFQNNPSPTPSQQK